MRHRFSTLLFSCTIAVVLSGCIEVKHLVKVRPDGSGTIEARFLVREEILTLMTGFARDLADSLGADPGAVKEPFSEEDIRKEASSFGPAVQYVRGKKLKTDGFEGYEATYSFERIDEVLLNPGNSSTLGVGSSEDDESTLRFTFVKGTPSILTVSQQSRPDTMERQEPETETEEDTTMLEQFREMIRGMKMETGLEIQGRILETNATHRDGQRITLMKIDFDSFLDNVELLRELERIPPGNVSEAKELLKNIPGIKVDLNDEVIVKFK